jgi:glycosyltransferase involved in cell wall biosynthesis
MAYGFGADAIRERYCAGKSPDETPYGLHHAEEFGWEVTNSVDKPESPTASLFRKVCKRILGFDLVHAYRNRKLIQASDIVWTNEEISYLSVCALPFIVWGMRRPRIIAQTVWLFNRWKTYSMPRRWMLEKLLKRTDLMTFHTQQYLEVAKDIAPSIPKQILPFGVSAESFPLTERVVALNNPVRLLSMGHDATRDWKTLLRAFGGDDRFELCIVCRWVTDEMIAPYPNVRCVRDPSMQGFRDLYTWADAVIVTMIGNLFSGITVAMEAIRMGVPVICSDTGGVRTHFASDEVIYVPPLDAIALCNAVLSHSNAELTSFSRKAQAKSILADNTTRGLARRYVELSKILLDI